MPLYTPRSGDSLLAEFYPYVPRGRLDLLAEFGDGFRPGLGRADYLFHSAWQSGHLDPVIGGRPTHVRSSQAWEWNGELFRLRNRNAPLFAPGRRADGSFFQGLLFQRGVEQQVSQPFDFSHADWGSVAVTAAPSIFTSNVLGYATKTAWDVPDTVILDTSEGAVDQDWAGDPKTFVWVLQKRTAEFVRFRIYAGATEKVYYKFDLGTGAFTALGSVSGLVSKGCESLGNDRWLVTITATAATDDVKAIAYPMDVGESGVTRFYYFGIVDGETGAIVDGPENTTLDGDDLTYTLAPSPQLGQVMVILESFVARQRPSAEMLTTPWVLGEEAPFLYRWEDGGDVGITYEPLVGSPVEIALTPTWEYGDYVEIGMALTAEADLRFMVRVNGNSSGWAISDLGPTNELAGLPTAWGGENLLALRGTSQRLMERFVIAKGGNMREDPVLGGAHEILDELAISKLLPNSREAA